MFRLPVEYGTHCSGDTSGAVPWSYSGVQNHSDFVQENNFFFFWYFGIIIFLYKKTKKKHKRFCVLTGITGVYKRTRDPFLCSSPLRDPLFLGGWRNTVLSEVVCQHRYVLSKCPLREGPRYQPWGKVRGQIIFFAWDFQTLVSLCPIASCP